eukprot:jgi/Orpsp1_1/1184017/evm.model.c7180000087685.1
MKIFSLLFILVILTLSHASSIIIPNILKRDNTDISKECENENNNSEYSNECMPVITIGNYKETCSNIISEKCKTFYNDPLKYFPICSQIPEFAEIFQPIIFNDLIEGLNSKYLTDEEGNLCPYSIYAITQTGQNEALSNTYVNMDQYAAYENLSFNTGSYSYQNLNAVKNIVSTLKSDK